MEMKQLFFGYLNSCADRNGSEYPESDWRAEYYNKPGLISIFSSEHKAPGKMFAYFYPYEPENISQKWLRTSAGDLTVDNDVYTVTTQNSIYSFIRDDTSISEDDKIILFANSYLNHSPLILNPDNNSTELHRAQIVHPEFSKG